MLIVGLTGGIGSGKSAVAERFAALGVPVIDADVVARQVVAPGSEGLAAVVAAFGESVLAGDGGLDRAAMRRRVFDDEGERRRLEAILHPRIRAEMDREIAELDAPYCILVIPLLIETGGNPRVARVLVVDAPDGLRERRVAERDGLTADEVAAVFRAQVRREERLAHADDVIVNEGDWSALDGAVAELHRRYLDLAGGLPATRRG